jgi:hypothetical protein
MCLASVLVASGSVVIVSGTNAQGHAHMQLFQACLRVQLQDRD